MPTITVTRRDGAIQEVEYTESSTLMEVLRNGGADELLSLCGGCCSCATCHVYIEDAYLDRLLPITPDEDELLESTEYRTSKSRLSCQVRLEIDHASMSVVIAPED